MSTRATNAGTSDRSRLVNARVGQYGPRNSSIQLAGVLPPAKAVAVSRRQGNETARSSAPPPWLSSCRAFFKNLNLAQTAIDIAALFICFLFLCVTAAAFGAAVFILFFVAT